MEMVDQKDLSLNYQLINLRGHFNNEYSQNEYEVEQLHFINMVHQNVFGQNRSAFDIEQTKRRVKIFLEVMDSDQVQQFLSNLRDIQQEEAKPDQTLPQEKLMDYALYRIPIEEGKTRKEKYKELMDRVTTKGLWGSLKPLLRKGTEVLSTNLN
jgi:hypothetical protein